MLNKLGDKCFVDSFDVTHKKGSISLAVELDGVCFESSEYDSFELWLQDIVNRVYDCAMGKLN